MPNPRNDSSPYLVNTSEAEFKRKVLTAPSETCGNCKGYAGWRFTLDGKPAWQPCPGCNDSIKPILMDVTS